MGIADMLRTSRAVNQMKAEHAAWAKTVTEGSVWYSIQPTTMWNRFAPGTGTPVHSRYVFTRKADWTVGGGWLTEGGSPSWAIWSAELGGTGLTQERQLTMQDCEAAAERLFEKQARHMQQAVGRAAGWDPAWAQHVERILMGA